jgi:hypothetical protein
MLGLVDEPTLAQALSHWTATEVDSSVVVGRALRSGAKPYAPVFWTVKTGAIALPELSTLFTG